MSRLLVRNGVFAQAPFAGSLGEAAPASPAEVAATVDLTEVNERTKQILAKIEEDARNRRVALMIAGASAIFAAVKLGLIAFPAIRSRIGRM